MPKRLSVSGAEGFISFMGVSSVFMGFVIYNVIAEIVERAECLTAIVSAERLKLKV